MSSRFRVLRGNKKANKGRNKSPKPTPLPCEPKLNLSEINPQSQSPLFSKIPAEIRNEIFKLALQGYIIPSKLYDRNTFWARPGFEGEIKYDLALRSTCKRVWVETKSVVWREMEVVFYGGNPERKPPEYVLHKTQNVWTHPLTLREDAAQWIKADRIRLIGQMFAFRENLLDNLTMFPFSASTVILTVRYTDWWWWEHNTPPTIREFLPIGQHKVPNSVTKVMLELENREGMRISLEKVVNILLEGRQNKDRQWERQDGRILRLKDGPSAVTEWKWKGPTKFDRTTYYHHGQGDTMDYVVKVLTWELAPKE